MPAEPAASFRLESRMRLRERRDFEQIKSQGKRLVHGCLIANWLEREENPFPRIGVVTSRKLGGAVARSRARRLMRECFRLHQHDLCEPVDLVLVARQSMVGKHFADVERDYLTVLRRANLLKQGK